MWIVTPENVSTPGMSGRFGVVSTPLALIRYRAVVSPSGPWGSVCTRHRSCSSSNTADNTLVPNRIRERRPYLSTQCLAYDFSSPPGA